ncbi:hypothetical protein Ga0100231_023380 [Opitutaceae bacterium TAV4]|uniref:hypothetical protein n=1 Tax=Geminisphaera colitermitum TaxID=1148786 RepID=UPI000158CFF6|nr:hypothetical protein [Geminisphaera colitermitum]RRJ96729.1 hypothetical protein Ga0100231_023380 [Opitutaceae bacterium TAV4]RRK02415.1 hypothetical protein Ga0100230_004525 [Opitutaceae bacterium TAV3]
MPLTIEPISVESVSPGGNATHSLRCDRRYHQMRYRTFVNGVATPVENVINKIIVTVNRQERRNLSVPRIRMINAVNLFSDPIDTVTMHFAEPWQEGYEAATRTAWDLAGAQSAEVTLDLKGQAAGAVVAIEALMVYDMGIHLFDTDGKITGTAGTPVFFNIRHATQSHALVDGEFTISDKTVRQNICRQFFFALNDDGEHLKKVIVRADDNLKFSANRQETKDIMADYGMNLLDDIPFVIPYDLNGRTECLYAGKSMTMEIHSPVAQTIDLLNETLHFSWN